LPPIYSHLEETQNTARNLRTITSTPLISRLSHLTLPEIDALTEQIARIVPAGNVPGLLLSGLLRLEGRQVGIDERRRHVDMLLRGVRELLDKATYGALFGGPAAVMLGYQKLLRLAGQDVDNAFPEGTWQFYLDYALREDTARHANETTGYQRVLKARRKPLSEADSLSAWIMTAITTLSHYDRLLENEWRERAYTAVLGADSRRVYLEWERQRPYSRGTGRADYPAYRRAQFDAYFQTVLEKYPMAAQHRALTAIGAAEQHAKPAYLRQMNILTRLEPGQYQEIRAAYPIREAAIAVVHRSRYFLIPLYPDGDKLIDPAMVRQMAAMILQSPQARSVGDADLLLARAVRTSQRDLRAGLQGNDHAKFNRIPIILNWEQRESRLPLATIRQGRRGLGDHALTLFFTEDSTVFDQSHILFDGAWGAALAEIMTNEALSWALHFARKPATPAMERLSVATLTLHTPDALRKKITPELIAPETSAETTLIQLAPIVQLRQLFKTRSELVSVTVNDLFILYRSIFGALYQPSPTLMAQVDALKKDAGGRKAHKLVMESLNRIRTLNPSILIPIDASEQSPRERVFPSTFRNPFSNFAEIHRDTLAAFQDYEGSSNQHRPGRDKVRQYRAFDDKRRDYLRLIAVFGAVMTRYRQIALSGQSTSTTAIKILAGLPEPLAKLLEQFSGQVEILNEVIKGEEVFSNVGRVAKGSTLRRFITAKDDNPQKTLAWGVLTDDQETIRLSLRDFRPHVAVLSEMGKAHLAAAITQDFLDSYADGFNLFIRELRQITITSNSSRHE
jgi:hypothetical protein